METNKLSPALVIRSTGALYRLQLPEGEIIEATLRGKLRLKDSKGTNPIAVGDKVLLDIENEQYTIREILPRHNHILRKSTRSHAQHQILAANIDQLMLVLTIEQPHTPLYFIDNFLVAAESYHIPTILLINKIDLLKKENRIEKSHQVIETYTKIGYPVYPIVATDNQTVELLKPLLQNKITFISGLSGVGKSTLLNKLNPDLQLKTAPIAKGTQKGKHTTTFAEMHPLPFGGYLIDAPGYNEFQIIDIEVNEVAHYFPEFLKIMPNCQYNNCLHINEPNCAIKNAVEKGEISTSRYYNYLSIIQSLTT